MAGFLWPPTWRLSRPQGVPFRKAHHGNWARSSLHSAGQAACRVQPRGLKSSQPDADVYQYISSQCSRPAEINRRNSFFESFGSDRPARSEQSIPLDSDLDEAMRGGNTIDFSFAASRCDPCPLSDLLLELARERTPKLMIDQPVPQVAIFSTRLVQGIELRWAVPEICGRSQGWPFVSVGRLHSVTGPQLHGLPAPDQREL